MAAIYSSEATKDKDEIFYACAPGNITVTATDGTPKTFDSKTHRQIIVNFVDKRLYKESLKAVFGLKTYDAHDFIEVIVKTFYWMEQQSPVISSFLLSLESDMKILCAENKVAYTTGNTPSVGIEMRAFPHNGYVYNATDYVFIMYTTTRLGEYKCAASSIQYYGGVSDVACSAITIGGSALFDLATVVIVKKENERRIKKGLPLMDQNAVIAFRTTKEFAILALAYIYKTTLKHPDAAILGVYFVEKLSQAGFIGIDATTKQYTVV